ncbi:MAG: hypothetical protein NT074_01970 [Methanomicrobiales archaeon]|jgi:chromosome segregation ATPase|nr:hypothetical protein [Methanomicrobiales archaeon]
MATIHATIRDDILAEIDREALNANERSRWIEKACTHYLLAREAPEYGGPGNKGDVTSVLHENEDLMARVADLEDMVAERDHENESLKSNFLLVEQNIREFEKNVYSIQGILHDRERETEVLKSLLEERTKDLEYLRGLAYVMAQKPLHPPESQDLSQLTEAIEEIRTRVRQADGTREGHSFWQRLVRKSHP